MEKIPATVQILTRNSEKGLKVLLPQLLNFAEILLIDGNSTDSTLDLAKKYNCRVIKQKETEEKNIIIDDFSSVRNKGLESASFDWQLIIDSDEYLDEKLVIEISSTIKINKINYLYYVPRKFVHKNKIIDISLYYPNLQIRLFNRLSKAKYVKPVHERLLFDKQNVKTENLNNYFYIPLDDYLTMKKKGDKYLAMSFDNIDKINLHQWFVSYLLFHLRASMVYFIRFLFNMFKIGNKMPLIYETHIFYYNWKMIYLSFKKIKF